MQPDNPEPEPKMATGGIVRPDLWADALDTGCGLVPNLRLRADEPGSAEMREFGQRFRTAQTAPLHLLDLPKLEPLLPSIGIGEVRPTIIRVRDWLTVVALALTIVFLTIAIGSAILIGAHYLPGQLPVPNAPVMPHPGVTR